MNKLEICVKILNSSIELRNWYCYGDGTKENPGNKDGFRMPEPDELTLADVTTHGTGYWGDVADLLIEDGKTYGIISDDDL